MKKSMSTPKPRATRYYGVWHGDRTKYFGPSKRPEDADEATWNESLRTGYDGASTEVITEEEFRKRKSKPHPEDSHDH